jgi:hypothetical protein
VEVRTSRAKAGAVVLLCAVLAGVCAWAAQTSGLAWVGVGLLGLGVLAAGKQVVRPTTVLRLDEDALVVAGGVRPRPPIPWAKVQQIEVRERRSVRPSRVAVSVDDGRNGSHWVEFSDTWLDTDAKTLGRAIADRAGGGVQPSSTALDPR